ncbi:hypothetical protein AB2L27_05390 [Kineococcus sp. LSe6-4]|uniref:Uncharacterized protein n=1 Tax=Kineococcus halophytocola TaxID=3234027 RepID=A0ABV4GYQ3_9ACTN
MTTVRWWRRGGAAGGDTAELHREVERLTRENMRLRLERQRPHSLSQVAEQLRVISEQSPETLEALEAQDEAHHVRAQTESMRRALVDALDALTVAVAQTRRQLAVDLPLTEIDRRVVERRRSRGAHVADSDADADAERAPA